MKNELYNQAEKFMVDSFTKVGKEKGIPHLLRTKHWLLELKPDADEAFCIAAVSHDIERAFRNPNNDKAKTAGFLDDFFLRYHPEKGAEIMGEFLKAKNADDVLIKRVKHFISKHETGGDDEQSLLRDADSVSFFENNVGTFVKSADEIGKEKIKEKFDWMFGRITGEKAKEIARPWYEEALGKLG
jgi:hypothetical protein